MSYGFTGRVFSFSATRFFNTVRVYFLGEYETHTMRTTEKGFCRTAIFPTRFRAMLYQARINKQQFKRYNGTPYTVFDEHPK